ncbi:MAG: DUF2512 family protein [Clostridia bacterium]|nr:DUF2512 family protein [Clostridia bacterium]
MSKTTNALLFKFLMTLVFAVIAFSLIGGNAFKWVFLVAVLGTVVDYLVGDLFILPQVGNLIASAINGVLAALIAFLTSMAIPAFVTRAFPLVVFGILIAVGEYFFHQYLLKTEEVEP